MVAKGYTEKQVRLLARMVSARAQVVVMRCLPAAASAPMPQLIDRRANGARQERRQPRAVPAPLQDADPATPCKTMVGERKLSDIEQGGEVRISRKDISEPVVRLRPRRRSRFRAARQPGILGRATAFRVPTAQARARGGDAGGTGESEDAFVFSLSREEFMQIFFDDLELPHLERTVVSANEALEEHPRRLHAHGRAGQPRHRSHAGATRWRAASRWAAASRAEIADAQAALRGRRRRRAAPSARARSRRARAARAAAPRAAVSRRPWTCAIATALRDRSRSPAPRCSA